jgi:putative endonuclease
LLAMFYVYVIYSEKTGQKYTGFTSDLENRLKQHNEGGFKGSYTNGKGPWVLVYSEVFDNRIDALKREKYLKTGVGRDFIKQKTGY